jgi:hypothetical protein
MKAPLAIALTLVVALGAAVDAEAQNAASRAEASRRAMLVRGADSARGLPFFGPNAIAALSGAYRLVAGGGEAVVWYTRDSVVLGPEWKRTSLGGVEGSQPEARVLARARGIAVALEGEKYSLFFELASDAPSWRAFAFAFDRKFRGFFDAATSDAELSFPAYVDY